MLITDTSVHPFDVIQLEAAVENGRLRPVETEQEEELLANDRNLEEIREFLEVDSVGYISLEGMLDSAQLPDDHFCTACWSGKYRIPVQIALNKFTMERYQMFMFDEMDV